MYGESSQDERREPHISPTTPESEQGRPRSADYGSLLISATGWLSMPASSFASTVAVKSLQCIDQPAGGVRSVPCRLELPMRFDVVPTVDNRGAIRRGARWAALGARACPNLSGDGCDALRIRHECPLHLRGNDSQPTLPAGEPQRSDPERAFDTVHFLGGQLAVGAVSGNDVLHVFRSNAM